MEAYQSVRKQNGMKRDRKFWAVVILVLLLFTVPIALGISTYVQLRQGYQSFLAELSTATVHTYAASGIKVADGEDRYVLTGEAVYIPFRSLSIAGMGRPGEELPSEGDTLTFDYDKGVTLQVWTVPMSGYTDKEKGLFVHFVSFSGNSYDYTTDKLTVAELRNLCQAAQRAG